MHETGKLTKNRCSNVNNNMASILKRLNILFHAPSSFLSYVNVYRLSKNEKKLLIVLNVKRKLNSIFLYEI